MKAVHPLPIQNNNGPVRPAFLGKARGHPAGSPRAKYCFAFNKGQPCSFHKCSRCQGHHPAHRCQGKGQGNGAATSTHYRQKFVLCCLRLNVHFTARHVPGRENILADKLSRLQVDSFKVAAPWADRTPTPLPQQLCPSILGLLYWCKLR